MCLKHQLSSPFYFLFSLLFFYSALSNPQVCNNQDQSVLLTFFDTIQASYPPLNWSTTISCCHWEGVNCDNNSRITHLNLSSRGIKGIITSSLGNLVSLIHLNHSNNSLSGPLPNGLFGLMDSLEVIDLSSNCLSGNFSSSLSFQGSLPMKIHFIDISNNQFQGSIEHTWFSGMKVLNRFNCSNNKLSGAIPSFICLSSPFLKSLDLSHNLFSGPLSDEIGKCSNLKVFRAGFNSLWGSIPSSIFKLRKLNEISIPSNDLHGTLKVGTVRHSNLRFVDFSSNSISGPIPQKIGNLLQLEKLYLDNNNLSGPIPSSLMRCINLIDIFLAGNCLVGEISELDWSGLVQLQKLDLSNNSFNGSLPKSIYSCKSLVAYRVSMNNFSGQISPKIVDLKSLSFLSLSSNSFTNITKVLKVLANCQNLTILLLINNFCGETLPSKRSFLSSTGFPKLQVFSLEKCDLIGFFPKWLSHIKTLRVLGLSLNQITGKLPNWIGTFPRLFNLDLRYNNLIGEVPQKLCQLPLLVSHNTSSELFQIHLDIRVTIMYAKGKALIGVSSFFPSLQLGHNKLSGNIPSEIGMLQGLHILDLEGNQFSGHIPLSISNLKNLERLGLAQNNLSGELPASLKGLNFLSYFNVSYNDLQGPIPTGGQFDTFDGSSFEGNQGLCGELLHHPCSNKPGSNVEVVTHNGAQSHGKKLFLDGLFTGFAFGFSSVLVIFSSYVWFRICK